MYRAGVIILCLVFVGLQYRLWFADGGYAEIDRLEHRISSIEESNAQARARNNNLEAEINDLKNGTAAMEGRARADLGMVGENEPFFLVIDADRARTASR